MKKRQRLEIPELVQEIDMLIDDWHFTKCPGRWKCKECPHNKLCNCLMQLSYIKFTMYNSNGELKNEHL